MSDSVYKCIVKDEFLSYRGTCESISIECISVFTSTCVGSFSVVADLLACCTFTHIITCRCKEFVVIIIGNPYIGIANYPGPWLDGRRHYWVAITLALVKVYM